MLSQLPKQVNYLALAKSGANLIARADLSEFRRLSELLSDTQGEVEVQLKFSLDPRRFVSLVGELRSGFHLQCQRCLGLLELEIAAPVHLAIVDSERVDQPIPEPFEAEIVNTESIDLWELVENELILLVPIAPVHAGSCMQPLRGSDKYLRTNNSPDNIEQMDKRNPFAELAALKSKLSKKE
jgi:DUF177 domain-containing protein